MFCERLVIIKSEETKKYQSLLKASRDEAGTTRKVLRQQPRSRGISGTRAKEREREKSRQLMSEVNTYLLVVDKLVPEASMRVSEKRKKELRL